MDPATFWLLLATLVFFVFLGVLLWWAVRDQQRRMQQWGQYAAEHGLSFRQPSAWKAGRIEGELHGQPVSVSTIQRNAGQTTVSYTVCKAQVQGALPVGLRVHPAHIGTRLLSAMGGQDIEIGDAYLDHELRIRADVDDETHALFAEARLRRAFTTLIEQGGSSRVQDGEVVFEHNGTLDGEALAPFVDATVELAEALAEAQLAPWKRFADAHRFTLKQRGWQLDLSGYTRQGRASRLRRAPEGKIWMWVQLFGAGQPPGVLADLAVQAGEGGIALGDPVLDGRMAVSGHDAEAMRRLFRIADAQGLDLRERLLELVAGHPGSEIKDGAVHLVVEGHPVARLEVIFKTIINKLI